MVATAQRSQVMPFTRTSTGGGGGGRLNGLKKKLGDGKGGYDAAIDNMDSGLVVQDHIVKAYQKHTKIKDLWNPGLISSETAGRAETFRKQHIPKLVDNNKKYFKGLEAAYSGDLQRKEDQSKAMIHAGGTIVNQRGHVMEVIKSQMDNEAAMRAQDWELGEHYLETRGSLNMSDIGTDRI